MPGRAPLVRSYEVKYMRQSTCIRVYNGERIYFYICRVASELDYRVNVKSTGQLNRSRISNIRIINIGGDLYKRALTVLLYCFKLNLQYIVIIYI